MANFEDVHRKQLYAADRKIRKGEIWSIYLREPLGKVADGPNVNELITIVGFIATANGRLEPAHALDRASIAEWKKRHRDTPLSHFGLPEGLLGDGQSPSIEG